MEPNDLVLTPEGMLALVETVTDEQVKVQIANTETRVLYPAGTPLAVVARAGDVARARAGRKEG